MWVLFKENPQAFTLFYKNIFISSFRLIFFSVFLPFKSIKISNKKEQGIWLKSNYFAEKKIQLGSELS